MAGGQAALEEKVGAALARTTHHDDEQLAHARHHLREPVQQLHDVLVAKGGCASQLSLGCLDSCRRGRAAAAGHDFERDMAAGLAVVGFIHHSSAAACDRRGGLHRFGGQHAAPRCLGLGGGAAGCCKAITHG
jgi:hypothetical protein